MDNFEDIMMAVIFGPIIFLMMIPFILPWILPGIIMIKRVIELIKN